MTRLAMFVGAGCLIFPGWKTDLIGLVIVGVMFAVRIPDTLNRYTIGLFRRKASV